MSGVVRSLTLLSKRDDHLIMLLLREILTRLRIMFVAI